MKAIETGLHVEIGASNERGQYVTRVLSRAIYFVRSLGGAAYNHKSYCSDYTIARILSWGSQDSQFELRVVGNPKGELGRLGAYILLNDESVKVMPFKP